jgi:nicotinate-nucleotide adenylyltransferase
VQAKNVEMVDVEEKLAKDGPVYSYDVLVALQAMYPEDQLFLAVGPDNGDPAVWNKFYKADQILSEFGRVVAPNMGDHKRSTEIRFMLLRGASYESLAEVATPAVAALLVGEYARLYGQMSA